ncbi:MAG: hypothetical protein LBQ49_00515, partial [Rickettsiales bacterium]|nr:hypothetical protein [Rickettsiales bacterium]
MKKLAFFILHSSFFIAPLAPLAAAEGDLASALENVRRDCGGIEAEFNKIKTMAGVNAAVAGVGAMAGGGAVAAGFAKMSKDDEAEVLVRLEKLRDIPEPEDQGSPAEEFAAGVANYLSSANEELRNGGDEVEKLKAESKMLGNWRTGLMFGNTATNIAGAAIAEGNKFDENLVRKIENCKKSTAALDEAALQARVDGEDPTLAEKI